MVMNMVRPTPMCIVTILWTVDTRGKYFWPRTTPPHTGKQNSPPAAIFILVFSHIFFFTVLHFYFLNLLLLSFCYLLSFLPFSFSFFLPVSLLYNIYPLDDICGYGGRGRIFPSTHPWSTSLCPSCSGGVFFHQCTPGLHPSVLPVPG
jgi:hypothetical protein